MAKIKVMNILPKNLEDKMSQDLIEYEESQGIEVNYKRFFLVLYDDREAIIGFEDKGFNNI